MNKGPKKGQRREDVFAENSEDDEAGAPPASAIPKPKKAKPKKKKAAAAGAPSAPSIPQMELGAKKQAVTFTQSTTLDSGVAHDMKYRLVLKDDFSEDPPHGVIFVNKNVQNKKLTFKVQGVNGEVFEESREITALPENDTLDVQKLITHKAAILTELQARENAVQVKIQALKTEEKKAAEARKIEIASELEAQNNKRLFRNKEELAQTNLDKEWQKRLDISKNINSLMVPAVTVDPKDSNAGKIQYLAGLNLEGLAIKMMLELFGFAFKLLWAPTGGYLKALNEYQNYAHQYPESVYNGQILYEYYSDAKGNFKLDRTHPVAEKDITLDVILANGYLPKPSKLEQLREVYQDHVIGQLGVDLYEDITRAKKHFHGQSDKPSHAADADHETQDGVIAGRRPAPVPRPTGK